VGLEQTLALSHHLAHDANVRPLLPVGVDPGFALLDQVRVFRGSLVDLRAPFPQKSDQRLENPGDIGHRLGAIDPIPEQIGFDRAPDFAHVFVLLAALGVVKTAHA
jgi:hypothetical protein